MASPGLPAAALLAVSFLAPAAVPAAVFLTADEALRLAFPGSTIERRTAFLTDAQLARARALAGVEVPSKLVHSYRALRDGRPAGTAYFDTHRVRTQPETVMVVLDASGKVRRVEVLAFAEPPDYLPRGGWYGQFSGRALDAELTLKRAIRPITGATLTARATTAAVRRVLAIHQVLEAPVRSEGAR